MTPSPFKQATESFYSVSEPLQVEKTPENKDQYVNDFSQVYSPFNIASQIQAGETTEDVFNESLRDVTRVGSRMLETIVGLPGDIHQFGKKLREKVPSQLDIPPFSYVQKGLNKAFDLLPTQESLQKRSEELTEGYTKPRSENETTADEIVKTFSGMITAPENPGQLSRLPQSLRTGLNLFRKLGTAISGEYAKKGAEKLGAGGIGQEAAKQGLMFVLSMGLPRITGERSPDNLTRSLYERRDNAIPQGTMVTPSGLEARLRNYNQNTLQYGGPTPEKDLVGNQLTRFVDRLTGRAMEMPEVLQMYRDVNRNRAAAMAAPLDRAGVRQSRQYWGEIADIFNDSIEGYLAPISQEALDFHRQGNSVFSTLMQSRRASNFIMNKARSVPLQTGVMSLFGGGVVNNPLLALKGLAGATAGAGAAAGLAKTGEMAYRFIMNEPLRHYYTQVLENAIRENGPGTINALKKLDKRYLIELKDPKSSVNQPMPPSQFQK